MGSDRSSWYLEYIQLQQARLEQQEIGVMLLVEQMLNNGKTPEAIHDFCGISAKLIQEVVNIHADGHTVEQICC